MRRYLRDLDLVLVLTTLLLIAFGMVVLASATASLGGPWSYLQTRLLHLGVALGALLAVLFVDYRRLAAAARFLYAGNILLLVAVLLIGVTRLGAQRWIPLGPFGGFQPSEIAKIVLIVTLARHLAGARPPATLPGLVPFLAHVGLPMLLIVRQPDLGPRWSWERS